MYKIIYPVKDATLYQRHPDRNTGVDQILELTKLTSGSIIESTPLSYDTWGETLNTRILLDFDISTVSASIASGTIINPRVYLKLFATEGHSLPIQYTLHAHPVSSSWSNGTGYYNNNPQVTNGVSWNSRNGKHTSTPWTTPGGDYITTITCSKTIDYEIGDVRMDVTDIVTAWISGSIPRYGMVVKHTSTGEGGSDVLGSIKFFSKDTHTIYVPRLEVLWNDSAYAATGSVSEISSDNAVIWIKNLKGSYKVGELATIRIGARGTYASSTYSLTSEYLTPYRLPVSSYYSIVDVASDTVIVDFDTVGTKISSDANGSYFKVDFSLFMPVRYYKFVLKVEYSDGTITYIDTDYEFKVVR